MSCFQESLAKGLAQIKPIWEAERAVWKQAVEEVATTCEFYDPDFDKEEFLELCETGRYSRKAY